QERCGNPCRKCEAHSSGCSTCLACWLPELLREWEIESRCCHGRRNRWDPGSRMRRYRRGTNEEPGRQMTLGVASRRRSIQLRPLRHETPAPCHAGYPRSSGCESRRFAWLPAPAYGLDLGEIGYTGKLTV